MTDEMWHLYAWCGLIEGTRTHDQRKLRVVSPQEHEELLRAHLLLRQLLDESPYQGLVTASERFASSAGTLERQWRTERPRSSLSVAEVERSFKGWLGAFRSFDDQTSHLISQEFGGPESVPFRTFKTALADQYDANFAYRLCCALRNVSEHAVSVLNRIRLISEEQEGGGVTSSVELTIDGPALAASSDRMKSTMREELSRVTEPLVVPAIMHSAMDSCWRAFAAVLISVESSIDRAASGLLALHQEAVAAGGLEAIIQSVVRAGEGEGRGTMEMQAVNIGRARLAQRALVQAAETCARSATVRVASDFTLK